MPDFRPTPKQEYAYLKLKDKVTREIGYGGGAGGGKSYIGCFWLLEMCLNYPKTRWLMGRKELTNLKRTTLSTFFKVIGDLGLNPNTYFKLNSQTNTINFHNGSQIILMDMARQPSDPDYLRFGGLELTGYFLDESNEVEYKAIQILKSRIGRQKNKEYGLLPKAFETFNPSKNHIYTRFYEPYKNKKLGVDKIFILALATDNTYLDDNYIEQLKNLDEVTRQRLLYGNFDYDDDNRSLVSYNKILDCFSNTYVDSGERYIVSDLAMQGRDRFIISVWEGMRVHFEVIKSKSTGKEIEEDLKRVSEQFKVPRSNIIVDSDGMGSYLSSYMENINEFHGGSTANDSTNYKNLKSECAFKLAQTIEKGLLYINTSEDIKSLLIEEMSQLKRDNIDKDEMKKHIIKKEEIKENIGRSPDFLDVLIMRMWFEVKVKTQVSVLDDFEF